MLYFILQLHFWLHTHKEAADMIMRMCAWWLFCLLFFSLFI